MIEALISIATVGVLALGATMVSWSFALVASGKNNAEFIEFVRMYLGFFILISVGGLL